MKHAKMAAASSFAICLVLLLAGPAAAQNASENQGGYPGAMPADHSTPEERAATAALNRQISDANRAADAQAARDNALYQKQRAQYEEERARYRDAMQRNRLQQRDYRARRAAYEALRAHYASERAAYRRHDWPDRHRWMRLGDDVDPLGLQLLLVDGAPAGKVVDAVHAPDGQIEALQVDLFGGAQVWLDASDVRYDRSERALMTNLDRRDLSEMAAEHL
jgi:hypothetical protein